MTGIRRALPPVLLAAAALACAHTFARSQSCPMQRPPQPLRRLYEMSERVVVARVGAGEVLKTGKDGLTSLRFALRVTESVKGEPARVLYYHRDEYVRQGADDEDGEAQPVILFGNRIPRLKRGERYLFFLIPRKEGDGYTAGDESYGIRHLSDEELKVHLERLKELADITRRGPADKLALVEWLVRCAEHPSTRWDGAYELFESAEAASRLAANAATVPDEVEAPDEVRAEVEAPDGEAAPVEESAAAAAPQESGGPAAAADSPAKASLKNIVMPGYSGYTPADPALAPLLSAVQKHRLADALFGSGEPGDGDDLLIQLVKDFDDPRFPNFLLARLHRFADEAPPEAERWLRALTHSLKNKQLDDLARSYTQDAAYFEEDEAEAAEAADESKVEVAEETSDDGEAASEELKEAPTDTQAASALAGRFAARAERAARKRSAMLKGLLSRIDLFVATGQLASN